MNRLRIAVLVAVLIGLISMPATQVLAAGVLLQINSVRSEAFPDVTIYLTVVDDNGLPVIPEQSRVQVTHNGRQVVSFSLDLVDNSQEGLAAVALVDTSGSMQGAPLDAARDALNTFVQRMGPKDRAGLMTFGGSVQTLQEPTDNKELLTNALGQMTAAGDTLLYDAGFNAVNLLSKEPLGRRVMVIITDGEDTKSALKLEDVVARARQANTPVYMIGFGEAKADTLARLSQTTGGGFVISPDPSRLGEDVERIATRLRTQWVLKYKAPDSQQPENEVRLSINQDGVQNADARRFAFPVLPDLVVALQGQATSGTVSGPVALEANVGGAIQIESVEYLVDGTVIGTAKEAPFPVQWESSRSSPGDHELTVRVKADGRQAAQSSRVTVAAAPQVGINQPAPNQAISGKVRLVPDLTNSPATTAVEWTFDQKPIATVNSPPFEFEWDVSQIPPGSYTLGVRAVDAQGNGSTMSRTVNIGAPGAQAQVPAPAPAPGAPGAPAAAPAPAVPGAPAQAQVPAPAAKVTVTVPVTAGPYTTPATTTARTPTATPGSGWRDIVPTSSRNLIIVAILVLAVGGGIALLILQRRSAAASASSATGGPTTSPTMGAISASGPPSSPRQTGQTGPSPAFQQDGGWSQPGPAAGSTQSRQVYQDDWGPDPWTPPPGPGSAPGTPPPGSPPGGPPGLHPDSGTYARGGGSNGRRAAGLIAESSQGGPQQWSLTSDEVIIGREPAPGVLVIADQQVSAVHAKIRWDGTHYYFEDLSPRNPTLINDRRFTGSHRLENGDRLLLGGTVVAFRYLPN